MSDAAGADYTAAQDWTRMGDQVEAAQVRAAAYARLFRSPLGRQVLADFLEACGVGAPKLQLIAAPGLLEHAAGMNDAAVMLVDLAGWTGADVAAHVNQPSEEGYFDERHTFE